MGIAEAFATAANPVIMISPFINSSDISSYFSIPKQNKVTIQNPLHFSFTGSTHKTHCQPFLVTIANNILNVKSSTIVCSNSDENHRSCFSLSSRRNLLLFMMPISFMLPPHSLAEFFVDDSLSTIQSSVRHVLSKAKAAGILRLVFHDAGTYDMVDRSGGMNGSVLYELTRSENAGLNASLKVLEKAKREIEKIHEVTWADLIAVAGAEAVFLCGGPAIPIKVGRLDVREPDPEGKLPRESLDASGLKRCFQRKGFSTQELVALSGAHTLGSKGFGNPFVFDNAYFKILLQKPWTSSASMSSMIGLPSDHALAEDKECLRWIRIYAEDEDRFFVDFANAYTRLVDCGAVWKPTDSDVASSSPVS